MANHFLCSCVYDGVCDMDHESAKNTIVIIKINSTQLVLQLLYNYTKFRK